MCSPPMKRKIFSFPSAGSFVEYFIVASITKLTEVKSMTKTHMMANTNSSEIPEAMKFRFKNWGLFSPTSHPIIEKEEHCLHIDVESELENDNSGRSPEEVVEEDDNVERERAKQDDREATDEGEKSWGSTDGDIDLSLTNELLNDLSLSHIMCGI